MKIQRQVLLMLAMTAAGRRAVQLPANPKHPGVNAGLSFELLQLSGCKRNHPLTRLLIAPGLWLQRITTRDASGGHHRLCLVFHGRSRGFCQFRGLGECLDVRQRAGDGMNGDHEYRQQNGQ